MELRSYSSADRDLCLAVFDSNTPRVFDPGARREFEEFLDRRDCPYFVMEHDGAIVGCGGYAIEQALARLVWGMVRCDSHGLGLGRYLLLFRLREITKAGGIQTVHLETPRHSAQFYEKQGFKVIGAASGLDRVEMMMKLVVCP
ncbi:MAG TPA: GNAT family N-acetyltransferase [Bryobacteraceae bacterium]